MQKGYQNGDRTLIDSIPEALNATSRVCSSVNVGSTRSGINMDAVAQMGRVVKDIAAVDPVNCMSLVVFANAVEDNPFMAGAFHGVGEADRVINVGISGPGVVKRALEQVKGEPIDVVSETIKKTAFKVTRMGQLVGNVAAERLVYRLVSSIYRWHQRQMKVIRSLKSWKRLAWRVLVHREPLRH